MKTICLILFWSMTIINLSAQTSDYDQIKQTLTHYMEGGKNSDFETLKKAFHPTATMKFIGEEYTEVIALEFFEKKLAKGIKENRINRIHDISITGNAASARLELEYPTFTFIDYMSLLKIDGQWLIVSKIFNKRMKEI